MKSALLAFALASLANASVRYIPETKVWVLDTDRTPYAIGVNENGDGVTSPVGLIRAGGQFATAGANLNFPGLSLSFDI